ncbi:hypothetical protein GQ55_2G057700 [Panicum hallii var. hallii]|uniref:KIB1-4 beta-propeller domain-containing protein n=1 Tax=Panicum hallii var. hallii TaxID=1504633 RepID=A0A2T7ELU7_9POAL|nr:hypothetical protein GQ55_2G057700 [Panicum hallii var. hallii]
MPSTLPTQKRASRDWTSLPFDINDRVGEHLLAADDIDYYMAFRAASHNWRSATKDYPEKADYSDPTCFQPSKWALLGQRDDLITLVNVDTGRFLRKSIPLLRKYFFIGATGGGLLLLGEATDPHRALVLNPFTGSIAHFKAPVPVVGVRAIAVTKAPLMVFVSSDNGDIMWADQNSERFKRYWGSDDGNRPTCMTSFAGLVYATDQQGAVIASAVSDAAAGEQRPRSALTISWDTIIPCLDTSLDTSYLAWLRTGKYNLVESRGDLLLVTRPPYFASTNQIPVVVHRIDTERKMLEPVSSIGSRAIFVGPVRCLSIDADKFRGIKGGCVYFVESLLVRGVDYKPPTMTVFHVAYPWRHFISFGWCPPEGCFRPFIQVLADYCRSVHYSELFEMEAREWGLDDPSSSDSESDESSYSETDDEALSFEPDE